jgi:tripartite-type tricarboxylate transporter receptor subunit TctC
MTRLLRVVMSLLLLLFALIATAQTYPSKSVRMVVPFAAGAGSNDIMARLIAQKLTETFGQQVVVDNRPGASGIIGTDIVAKAQPDGYTLLMMSLTFSVNPSLFSKLPYDGRVRAADAGRASVGAGEVGGRIHCVRESQPGQAQFRVGRPGHDTASRR